MINGKILLPGEVFSFNDTVGPRSEDGGYKTAHTYVAGKVIDGIGGGICQVSSTLYNAVLNADLEVVERRNHMFTVGYVPYGQDATVSYGTTDFRFKNSTSWPIKLNATVTKNNYIIFTFLGTNENPDKKVIMTQKIIKNIPFEIKYIDDPTLPAGKTIVKQEGKQGLIVETYKTIKDGTKVISQTKIHTSKYSPLTEEVRRGPGAATGTAGVTTENGTVPAGSVDITNTEDIPADSVNPSQDSGQSGSSTSIPDITPGVDDADNPPAID
jgi:hypothetical protein